MEMVQDLLGTLQRRYRTYWKLYRDGTGPTGDSIETVQDLLVTLYAWYKTYWKLNMRMVQVLLGTNLYGTRQRLSRTYWGLQ
eukprot:7443675-Pyramimonas_sp.AAC.1